MMFMVSNVIASPEFRRLPWIWQGNPHVSAKLKACASIRLITSCKLRDVGLAGFGTEIKDTVPLEA